MDEEFCKDTQDLYVDFKKCIIDHLKADKNTFSPCSASSICLIESCILLGIPKSIALSKFEDTWESIEGDILNALADSKE